MAVDSVLGSICYDDVEKEEEQEEYIDMEVSSYKTLNLFCHTNPSEFEFQMFSSSSDRELTTTSPADELFYKGKLLPLHLPPRLQMVEKLLQDKSMDTFDEFFSTPLDTSPYATPIANTPFRSCNVSPTESCQVSRELNPEDYFLDDHSTAENPKKSWTRKLTLTKQSSIGLKLKASRDYLRSFFGKPSAEESRNKVPRTSGKKKEKGDGHRHRRSFSYAIKRFSTTNTSSGTSSFSSSSDSNSSNLEFRVHQQRSINTGSDIENQIQSAIAHCKRSSQQQLHSRKTVSDMGFCSLAASRIVCDDKERQVLCRG
ncbi:probable membrane-associated kinase regulator 4 [Lactuca sativa]|uniref:probable membrane-associated kinase regulator 4 n=1 Tax=Lactuca sativa TaxID=4236 RepID=UPI000CB110E5|nr:probable membrane-associated kinase regulator 4 [Lactuca sativa]